MIIAVNFYFEFFNGHDIEILKAQVEKLKEGGGVGGHRVKIYCLERTIKACLNSPQGRIPQGYGYEGNNHVRWRAVFEKKVWFSCWYKKGHWVRLPFFKRKGVSAKEGFLLGEFSFLVEKVLVSKTSGHYLPSVFVKLKASSATDGQQMLFERAVGCGCEPEIMEAVKISSSLGWRLERVRIN